MGDADLFGRPNLSTSCEVMVRISRARMVHSVMITIAMTTCSLEVSMNYAYTDY